VRATLFVARAPPTRAMSACALPSRFSSVNVLGSRTSRASSRRVTVAAAGSSKHEEPPKPDGLDLFADAFGPPTSKPKPKAAGSGNARRDNRTGTRWDRGRASRPKRATKGNTQKQQQQQTAIQRRSVAQMMGDVNAPQNEFGQPEFVAGRNAKTATSQSVRTTTSNPVSQSRARFDITSRGTTWDKKSGHHVVPRDVISNLARLCETGLDVVVLTDCDVAGRQLRSRVVLEVPTALHAFLGAHESSAAADTKWHAAGNVGVEHASVGAIRGAVRRARRAHSDGGSHGVSRNQFTRDDLTKHGLCGPDDASPDPVWRVLGGVATRRRLVGEYLGIGDCDAKQLVRQLNLFFEVCEFEDAIDALPKKGDDIPRKMTDGGAARFAGEHETANDNSQVDIYAYVPPGQAPLGFK
jgi:ribonuclease M5